MRDAEGGVAESASALPSLQIVIVNWNAGAHLRACLEAISIMGCANFRLETVTIVDNASGDRSCEGLADLPIPIDVVRNEANRGFAAACNQGAGRGRSRYLLFLNPDTRVSPDAVRRVVLFLEDPANRHVGICGATLVDERGDVSRSCARFPTPAVFLWQMLGLSRLAPRLFPPHFLSAEECAVSRDVDQVTGAFFLVRRTMFVELEGFDERFFVYFEEVDFSLRAKRLGYRSVFLADAKVLHRGAVSSDQVKAARLFYSLRSRFEYAFKHFSRAGAYAVVAGALTVELAARLLIACLRGSLADLGDTVAGYRRLAYWWLTGRSSRADASTRS